MPISQHHETCIELVLGLGIAGALVFAINPIAFGGHHKKNGDAGI